MHITVKVLPPERPANSLLARLLGTQHADKLEQVSIPAEPTDTFEQLWRTAEARYKSCYSEPHYRDSYFSRLQTKMGADIVMADAVGTLFDEDKTPREELVLVVQRNAIDRDCSMPQDTILRPKDFRKRKLDAEQESALKRLKLQEDRYGAPLESLNPDTPVMSREPQGRTEEEGAEKLEPRRDADGFVVPAKPNRPIKAHRQRRTAPPAALLDTQVPAQHSGAPSVQARAQSMQQHHRIPSGTAHSTTVQRSATVTCDNRQGLSQVVASSQATGNHSVQQKSPGPPTPDSDCRISSHEPPTSAQRPRPTPAVVPETAGKSNACRLAPVSGLAGIVAEQNAIEDDEDAAILNSFGAGDFDDDLASLLDDGESDNADAAVPGNANPTVDVTTDADANEHSSEPARAPTQANGTQSSNAFALLLSSQTAAASNGAGTPWRADEDRLLLQGLRAHLNTSQIMKSGLQRSDSAIRGRKKLLLQKYPNMRMPERVSVGSSPISIPSSVPTQTAKVEGRSESLPASSRSPCEAKATDVPGRPTLTLERGGTNSAPPKSLDAPVEQPTAGPALRASSASEQQMVKGSKPDNIPDEQPVAGPSLRVSKASKQQAIKGPQPKSVKAPGEQPNPVPAMLALGASEQQAIKASPPKSVDAPAKQPTPVPALHASAAPEHQATKASPPQAERRPSPTVVVGGVERNDAQQMLRKNSATRGQSVLNFPRDKGKGVNRPQRESTAELDRLYTRTSSAPTASHQQQAPQHQPEGQSREAPILINSGDEASEEGDDEDRTAIVSAVAPPKDEPEPRQTAIAPVPVTVPDAEQKRMPRQHRSMPPANGDSSKGTGRLARPSNRTTYSSEVRRIRAREAEARAAAQPKTERSEVPHPANVAPVNVVHSDRDTECAAAPDGDSKRPATTIESVTPIPPRKTVDAGMIPVEALDRVKDDKLPGTQRESEEKRKSGWAKTDAELWAQAAREVLRVEDTQERYEYLKLQLGMLDSIATSDYSRTAKLRKDKIRWKSEKRKEKGIAPTAKHLRPKQFSGETRIPGHEPADEEIVRYETDSNYDSSDDTDCLMADEELGASYETSDDDENDAGVDRDRHFSEVRADEEGEAASKVHAGSGTTSQKKLLPEIETQVEGTQIVPDSFQGDAGTVRGPEAEPRVHKPAPRPKARGPIRLAMDHATTSQEYRERLQREARDRRPDAQLAQEFTQSQESHSGPGPESTGVAVTPKTKVHTGRPTRAAKSASQQAALNHPRSSDTAPKGSSKKRHQPVEQPQPQTDGSSSKKRRENMRAETATPSRAPVEINAPSSHGRPASGSDKRREKMGSDKATLSQASILNNRSSSNAEPASASKKRREKVRAETAAEQPPTAAQKDKDKMPPPTVKPPRRRQRRESGDSSASLQSATSQDLSRSALKQKHRRMHAKQRQDSSSERGASLPIFDGMQRHPSDHKVLRSSSGTVPRSSQPRFAISEEFAEFRNKQFEFPTPKPAAPKRQGAAKLPFATDDEDESVRSD